MIGLGAVPILLVFMQPDLGTALVYAAALFAVLFFVGLRWRQLLTLLAVGVIAITSVLWLLPAAGVQVLKPYQAARLTLDPDADPSGITYNLSQSITAVGSGGLTGRGVIGASQTRLDYLPEHATDFAFASLAEQRGFVGCAILLLLYLLVVWRGLRVITGAGDLYGVVVAGGLVVAFLFQVFVNVGMTMGVAPVTGIPLPFVTVGGSSMVANLVLIGVLQSIHARGELGRGGPREAAPAVAAFVEELKSLGLAAPRRARPLASGRSSSAAFSPSSSRSSSGPGPRQAPSSSAWSDVVANAAVHVRIVAGDPSQRGRGARARRDDATTFRSSSSSCGPRPTGRGRSFSRRSWSSAAPARASRSARSPTGSSRRPRTRRPSRRAFPRSPRPRAPEPSSRPWSARR